MMPRRRQPELPDFVAHGGALLLDDARDLSMAHGVIREEHLQPRLHINEESAPPIGHPLHVVLPDLAPLTTTTSPSFTDNHDYVIHMAMTSSSTTLVAPRDTVGWYVGAAGAQRASLGAMRGRWRW